MSVLSTSVRATHLVTNAVWFGGALVAATSSAESRSAGGSPPGHAPGHDRARTRWDRVETSAIGLHLLSGLGIVADNRRRVVLHPPTTGAVVAKTVLTGGALALTVASRRDHAAVGRPGRSSDSGVPSGRRRGDEPTPQRWLPWAICATTSGLLVLDAYLGEQQRGTAGALDRPVRLLGR